MFQTNFAGAVKTPAAAVNGAKALSRFRGGKQKR